MSAPPPPAPHAGVHIELWISTLLRVGVSASLALVVAGTLLCFAAHPEYHAAGARFESLVRADAAFPHSVADVLRGVARMQGPALVMLGLLVLIATPVMRVAISILAFLAQRDRTYVIITSLVLALLLTSFLLGG